MSLEGKAAAENVLRGRINRLDVLTIDAYGVAVRNGFEGTEAEWLASLHGKDGKDGENGTDGHTPVNGVDYFTEDEKKEFVEEIAVMTKSSSFVPNTLTGGIVFADDVSGANHELEISVTGVADPTTVTVKQYKRNLLPTSFYHPTQSGVSKGTDAVLGKYIVTNGVRFYYESGIAPIVATNNDVTTATTAAAQFRLLFDNGGLKDGNGEVFYFPPGNYTKSVKVENIPEGSANAGKYVMYVAITTPTGGTRTVDHTESLVELAKGETIKYITVAVPAGEIADGVRFYPMFEYGEKASEWEPIAEPTSYTPNPDGSVSGVMSVSPAMTLMTNTPGATISCTYDTNEIVIDGDDTDPSSKKWQGKTWACVGDSMTEANGYTDVHYFDYISSDTGIAVVNMGDSGTGYAKYSPATNPDTTFLKRIQAADLTNADVITIMGGVNDAGAGLQIGNVTDTDTTTLCGCVNATIDAVHAAEIARGRLLPFGIITSPPAWSQPPTNPDNFITKWYAAIGEICRLRGIPFLDLYHCSGLRPWVDEYKLLAYTKDSKDSDGNLHGLHPDERGHEMIAPKIKAFLETLIL